MFRRTLLLAFCWALIGNRPVAADSIRSGQTKVSVTPKINPGVPPGVAFKGVTAAMWAEINSQRVIFGDPNDCQAKVQNIPTSGQTLNPCNGNCINTALSSSNVVILKGGTYAISNTIELKPGKTLIGAPGEEVIIDAKNVEEGLWLRGNNTLANVRLIDAGDVGLNFLGDSSLVYQVSVARTGWTSQINANGAGIGVWYEADNNCIVSVEVYDSYNESGNGCDVCANGGNADGIRNSFGASNNTFIDAHSFRNGDDGWDFWEGNVAFVYFGSSFDNGKTTGKSITGDGNGIKLGRGSAQHRLYKTSANTNKADGFDLNGNTIQPWLVQCTATGNGGLDFAGIPHP
ncbi:MAG: hypothetical protein IT288_02370 [Bdellovibrionales bacterium]|nr:hypothetical protein [Bdellovibrionales bacterium]